MRASDSIGWRSGMPMLAIAGIATLMSGQVRAETIRVLAAGAVQAPIRQVEPAFSAATGHKLEAVFDTVGAVRQRVLAGDSAGVVILSRQAMDAVASAGKIEAKSLLELGGVTVALAVRKGGTVADISSPEALKRVLRAARSIAHADPARGATAGTHFARVLEGLGIAEEVKPRVTVLGFGGDVIDGVAQGRFEIGVSQSSEIVAHPGVTLMGSLPPPFDHRTDYLAGAGAGAGPGAQAFMRFLQEPHSRAAFSGSGFDTP
jgi:molybdate transport system substrate-binding protein